MRYTLLALLGVAAMALAGCETNAPNSAADRTDLSNRAKIALQQMTAQNTFLPGIIDNSVGYAIFPEVGQGAVGVGGATGQGVVYQNGKAIGTAKLDQLSVGPQVGGESYAELIVFQNQQALNRLMNESLEFGAQASATIVKSGTAAAGRFDDAVAVYILPKGGLMAGANLNGQKFHYDAYSNGDWEK